MNFIWRFTGALATVLAAALLLTLAVAVTCFGVVWALEAMKDVFDHFGFSNTAGILAALTTFGFVACVVIALFLTVASSEDKEPGAW